MRVMLIVIPLCGALVMSSAASSDDSGSWVELGGSATNGGISGTPGDPSKTPSLALGPDGRPAVAWLEIKGGHNEILFRTWDGAAWIGLGGSEANGGVSKSGGTAWGPSLAIDSQGRPVVAWSHIRGGLFRVYLRRWSGSAWEELGGSGSGTGLGDATASASEPSLVIGASDEPAVAWTRSDGTVNREIHLRRWDGASWIEIGGSATGGGISSEPGFDTFPSLALEGDGSPAVAWVHEDPGAPDTIHFRRWDGTAWIELGGSASGPGISGPGAFHPVLAVDPSGRAVIAWISGPAAGVSYQWQIHLLRWSGSAWEALGTSNTPGGLSHSPSGYAGWGGLSMALDADGNPYVAFGDVPFPSAKYPWSNDAGEILMRRWDGASWLDLGGSAAAPGLSNTPHYDSREPSIQIGPSGTPVVAWQEQKILASYYPDLQEIYLRSWR